MAVTRQMFVVSRDQLLQLRDMSRRLNEVTQAQQVLESSLYELLGEILLVDCTTDEDRDLVFDSFMRERSPLLVVPRAA